MKKEFFAVMLLIALSAAAFFNLNRLEKLTAAIKDSVELSLKAAENGNMDAARAELDKAAALWEQSDRYTHIFISHAETDSTADCFYDALAALNAESFDEVKAVYRKLIYHLDSMLGMERITLGSVF